MYGCMSECVGMVVVGLMSLMVELVVGRRWTAERTVDVDGSQLGQSQ